MSLPSVRLSEEITGHYTSWVSPFGHPRIKVCLATPRGFSQLATPFIACLCLGILHVLLVAYPHSPCRVTTWIHPRYNLRILSSLNQQCQRAIPYSVVWETFRETVFVLSLWYGADRNRTDDFRLAKAALSQLSYSPEYINLSLS